MLSFDMASSSYLQRLSVFAVLLFVVRLPGTRQQVQAPLTSVEDLKSRFGQSDSEVKLTTTLAEAAFDRANNITADFRDVISESDRYLLQRARNLTCPTNGITVFNFSRMSLQEALDTFKTLLPALSSTSSNKLPSPASNASNVSYPPNPPPPTTERNPSVRPEMTSYRMPKVTSDNPAPPPSNQPPLSTQPPPPSNQPPLSTQPPPPSNHPPLSTQPPPPSKQPPLSTQPPPPSNQPPLSSQPPPPSNQPPLSTQPPPPSNQPPLSTHPPPPSNQPPLSTQPPPPSNQPPLSTPTTLTPRRRKREVAGASSAPLEQSTGSTASSAPMSDGDRFLNFVCTNGSLSLLASLDLETHKKLLSPNLLAILTNDLLMHLKALVPNSLVTSVCSGLQEAEAQDLMVIIRVFSCSEQVKKLAKADPSVAAAVLDQFRQRVAELSIKDWEGLVANFSSSLPQDLLEKAPASVLMDNFQTLYSRERASVLLQKINLTAANASFVSALGDKLCELPRSAIEKIPKTALQAVPTALECVGTSNDPSLKSLVAKIFNATDAVSCITFLTTVDPLSERCWDLLSAEQIKSFNFTSLEKFDKLPVQLTRKLRDKMGLNDPRNWTAETMTHYPWLLATILPEEVTKIQPSLLKAVVSSTSLAQVDMPASVQRQMYSTIKESKGKGATNLTASDLRDMGAALPAMTPSDARSLSSEAVMSLVGDLKDDAQKMAKTTREMILSKLTSEQLRQKICQMGNLSADVSAQQLENDTMGSLGETLLNATCPFQCQQQAQCYAVYNGMKKALAALGMVPSNYTKDMVLRLRDTRAICGMPLDDVDDLPATAAIENWQTAFSGANCDNPKTVQALSEKYRLVLTYVTKTGITKAKLSILGPQAIVNTDLTQLRGLDSDGKKAVVELMGRQPLYNAGSDWFKQMLGYAFDAYNLSGNASAEINSTTVFALGYLLCSLNASSYRQLTPSAILDAAPILGSCPELSQSDLLTLQQMIASKTSKSYSDMDADDVAIRGTILFANCSTQSRLDEIPAKSLYEAVHRLVQSLTSREQSVAMRERQWKKSPLSAADKQSVSDASMCGLLHALNGRARYRAQTISSGKRRKRSTDSQPVTCEDIELLGKKANVLTAQQISDLNTTEFNKCADTLGTVTGWTSEQKAALIAKAKQTWGQYSNWTKELVQRMGSIAQGLTAAELASLSSLDLDVLNILGGYIGWSLDQLKAAFSFWLSNDTSVRSNISAITGSHLKLLGHFACGATPQQISGISSPAFKVALADIGVLYSCSAEQLDAWADLAQKALGPVTAWTYAQSAAADVVYAGLNGSSLSLLNPTQLAQISLDAFVRIKPAAFSALTVSQMSSLSTAQALSVTADQLSVLNPAQKAQLKALGATISDPSGAQGISSATVAILGFASASVWLMLSH